jgi:hypothetical protein
MAMSKVAKPSTTSNSSKVKPREELRWWSAPALTITPFDCLRSIYGPPRGARENLASVLMKNWVFS